MPSDLMAALQYSLEAAGADQSGAVLSDDGLYRYRLWRRWGHRESVAWIMLNPSTADATLNDQTIRRCMFYAKREGYDGIEVVNLYGLRCTQPKHLLDHPDPEGPDNSAHWEAVLSDHRIGMIVAAWGASRPNGCPPSKAAAQWFTGGWYCLGKTADGHPRHPSRLANDQPFESLVPIGDAPSRESPNTDGDETSSLPFGPEGRA